MPELLTHPSKTLLAEDLELQRSPGPFVRLHSWASSLPITGKDWVQMGNTPAGDLLGSSSLSYMQRCALSAIATNRPHLTKSTQTRDFTACSVLLPPQPLSPMGGCSSSPWISSVPLPLFPTAPCNASNQHTHKRMKPLKILGGLQRKPS